MAGVYHAPYPDTYRFAGSADACAEASLSFIRDQIMVHLTAPDEVACLEQLEVRLLAAEQLDHGAVPEDAAGDRRSLERRLLLRRQEIDTRGHHRLHGVRELELLRELAYTPAAVAARCSCDEPPSML